VGGAVSTSPHPSSAGVRVRVDEKRGEFAGHQNRKDTMVFSSWIKKSSEPSKKVKFREIQKKTVNLNLNPTKFEDVEDLCDWLGGLA
jgi:hypothetical protein